MAPSQTQSRYFVHIQRVAKAESPSPLVRITANEMMMDVPTQWGYTHTVPSSNLPEVLSGFRVSSERIAIVQSDLTEKSSGTLIVQSGTESFTDAGFTPIF